MTATVLSSGPHRRSESRARAPLERFSKPEAMRRTQGRRLIVRPRRRRPRGLEHGFDAGIWQQDHPRALPRYSRRSGGDADRRRAVRCADLFAGGGAVRVLARGVISSSRSFSPSAPALPGVGACSGVGTCGMQQFSCSESGSGRRRAALVMPDRSTQAAPEAERVRDLQAGRGMRSLEHPRTRAPFDVEPSGHSLGRDRAMVAGPDGCRRVRLAWRTRRSVGKRWRRRLARHGYRPPTGATDATRRASGGLCVRGGGP
jgi:hypothetical protein